MKSFKKIAFVISVSAALMLSCVFSCTQPGIPESPSEFFVGHLGSSSNASEAYLLFAWNEAPSAESYTLYQCNSEGSFSKYGPFSKYESDIKGNSCIKQVKSISELDCTYIVEGVSGEEKTLATYSGPPGWYTTLGYDISGQRVTWKALPDGRYGMYILVNGATETTYADTLQTPGEGLWTTTNSVSLPNTDVEKSNYYAVYGYIREADGLYCRMSEWVLGSDLLRVTTLRVSSYTTGSDTMFNINWDPVPGAESYTIQAYLGSASNMVETPVQGNGSTSGSVYVVRDLGWIGDKKNLYMRVLVNGTDGFSYSSQTIALTLPSGAYSTWSKCTVSKEMDNHLFVFRKSDDTFDIEWDDGKSYYAFAYLDGKTSSSSKLSWTSDIYTSPKGLRATNASNPKKLKFFLSSDSDGSTRTSNYVEMELK